MSRVLPLLFGLLMLLLRRPRDSALAILASVAVIAILVNGLFLQRGPHPAPMFAIKPLPVADDPTGTLAGSLRARFADADASQPSSPPARSRLELIGEVQRELFKRGYYDGAIDGAHGARTDAAIRDFERASGMKQTGEPTEALLQAIVKSPLKAQAAARPGAAPRKDPIAELLASPRSTASQAPQPAPVPQPSQPPSRKLAAIQRALSDFGYGQVAPSGVFGPDTRAAIERFERERKLPITGQVSERLARELAAMTGRPL